MELLNVELVFILGPFQFIARFEFVIHRLINHKTSFNLIPIA